MGMENTSGVAITVKRTEAGYLVVVSETEHGTVLAQATARSISSALSQAVGSLPAPALGGLTAAELVARTPVSYGGRSCATILDGWSFQRAENVASYLVGC